MAATPEMMAREQKEKEVIVRRIAKQTLVDLLMDLFRRCEQDYTRPYSQFPNPETDDIREEVRLFLATKLREVLPKGGKE